MGRIVRSISAGIPDRIRMSPLQEQGVGESCSNETHGSNVRKSLQVLQNNPLDVNEMFLHAHLDKIGVIFLACFDDVIVLF